jgi:hypothetical protein
MEENLQAKKAGYPLDMGGFWPGGNCRIIADSENLKGGVSPQGCVTLPAHYKIHRE